MGASEDRGGPLPALRREERRRLARQRLLGRLLSPLWIPLAVAVMRFALGWRIEGARELRARYREVRARAAGPLLVCANHLTMVDSFVVAWALASPWWYLRHYASLPWNTPERTTFAATWWSRALVYTMKCVPIRRGADRREAALVLARVAELLRGGEVALVFPEGGRSRSGRVDVESAAFGVGRLVKAVPGCLVLCVYLRGAGQETWSALPRRGERFRGALALIEPKADEPGLRGSLAIAREIVGRLQEMEREVWARP